MRESAIPSHDESKPAGKIEFYGGYEVYDENGIDLTLLRANFKRNFENRLADNDRRRPLKRPKPSTRTRSPEETPRRAAPGLKPLSKPALLFDDVRLVKVGVGHCKIFDPFNDANDVHGERTDAAGE
jgi:hypothetical protein